MFTTFNKLKKIAVHGIAFAFVVYSGMITFFVISMVLFAIVSDISLVPVLITIFLSAMVASYYYLKINPEGSEIRDHITKIINPYGPVKKGNLQAGVFGLFMALTLHVCSFLMPGTIIETVIVHQSEAFGYLFIYSLIVLGTVLIVFSLFSWIARKLYGNIIIPSKPAFIIVSLLLLSSILAVRGISPLVESYQPIISKIGLFVIGSIPVGILSVLFRPGSYLEKSN